MQASNRGKAFGALYLTGSLGGMFGSLYATNLGKTQVPHNMLNATTLACHCIRESSRVRKQLSGCNQTTQSGLKSTAQGLLYSMFTTAPGSENLDKFASVTSV